MSKHNHQQPQDFETLATDARALLVGKLFDDRRADCRRPLRVLRRVAGKEGEQTPVHGEAEGSLRAVQIGQFVGVVIQIVQLRLGRLDVLVSSLS